jgi:4-hydroxybenzoate polyprenyltransferase
VALKPFIQALRPRQWARNVLVFVPTVFAQKAFSPAHLERAGVAAVAFTLLACGVYLFNDLMDRERDLAHPHKRTRPIASGALSVQAATWALVPFVVGGLLLALWLGRASTVVCVTYVVLQGLYCWKLKQVPILDLFIVAAGYVFRVFLGATAVDVPISNWLYICILFGALFLVLSKRRHELTLLEADAARHRENLGAYTPHLLDQMISVVTASTVVAYSMYTVSDETVRKFGSDNLKFTIPFVLYGIFRYLYLVHHQQEGGSPDRTLYSDLPLIVDVFLFALVVAWVLYRPAAAVGAG